MTKKTRRRILIISSSTAVVLTGLILALLVYIKLFGLKTALEELVFVETDERYSLTIGKATVELSTLSFAFDSLTITRNAALPESGVREVTIPSLQLQVANLGSMFRSAKYDIKTLVIEEPFIGIDRGNNPDTAKFHLGQQVVKLYPAIESVLERFNIQYLRITRAALGVKHQVKPPLNLSLVDFLIEEWHVARLDDKSQLELTIGAQELNLEKVIFGFSGIEYNLQKRQLRIDDLAFSTIDSLSNSRVRVDAKLLLLDKLGYLDLFEYQRLTYEKVTIQNPIIDLRLNLKEKGTDKLAETNEKEVITRIIKQAVGECNVDTIAINQATINTVLRKGHDSTVVTLPNVNFTLYTFNVSNSQDYFETGEAEIELDKTSIALTDGLTISCQKLLFDRQNNLTFEDVDLFDAANKLNVVRCRSLKLTEFRLLPLIFDKDLQVETITIEDADINIPPENLFGSSGEGKRKGLNSIAVRTVNLKNVALNYNTPQVEFAARGVSLNLKNILKEQETTFKYAFHNVDIINADLLLIEKKMSIQLEGFDFDNDSISAKSISLSQNELDVTLAGIAAKYNGRMTSLDQIGYKNWKNITINSLHVDGTLPETNAQMAPSTNTDTIKAEHIFVSSLNTNLKHTTFNVSAGGNNLSISKAFFANNTINYQSLFGELTDVNFFAGPSQVDVKRIQLDLPQQIALHESAFMNNDLSVSLRKANITSPQKEGDFWKLPAVAAKLITVKKQGETLFKSDSIISKNMRFGGKEKPAIADVEVFNPIIELPEKDASETNNKAKPNLDFLDQLHFVRLHAGSLVLPTKEVITFGDINANAQTKELDCEYIYLNLPKFNLRAKHFALNRNQLMIDTFLLRPNNHWAANKKPKSSRLRSDTLLAKRGNGVADSSLFPDVFASKRKKINVDSLGMNQLESWYNEENFERSVVRADLYNTTVSGYVLDSLLLAGKLHHAALSIGGFYIHSKRDKRLPDPPFEEKPATLAGLIQLPKNIDIKTLSVKNGTIDVELISDVTGQTGKLDLTGVWADAKLDNSNPQHLKIDLVGGGKLYHEGNVDLAYKTLDSETFSLQASVSDFNLEKLNAIVLPLQAINIKSGYLKQFDLFITADNHAANGEATISYKSLHLTFYKKASPEEKSFRSELLTFFADGFVIKNRKKNARRTFSQPRNKERVTFHYWTISAINGALSTIRHGKKKKRAKQEK